MTFTNKKNRMEQNLEFQEAHNTALPSQSTIYPTVTLLTKFQKEPVN